eukprot:4034874-Amphidinium_carterae.1
MISVRTVWWDGLSELHAYGHKGKAHHAASLDRHIKTLGETLPALVSGPLLGRSSWPTLVAFRIPPNEFKE